MKQYIFSTILICAMLSGVSQDESDKKFGFSIRTGLGVPLKEISGTDFFIELGAQGEYRISEHFSVYMPLRLLQPMMFGDLPDAGTLGLLAGPRYYVGNDFFAGIGGGYAFYLDAGLGYGTFVYQPHIGLNRPKTQWTLGYYSGMFGDGYDEPGSLELNVAFKIGRR
jgi:hypothetical protein